MKLVFGCLVAAVLGYWNLGQTPFSRFQYYSVKIEWYAIGTVPRTIGTVRLLFDSPSVSVKLRIILIRVNNTV